MPIPEFLAASTTAIPLSPIHLPAESNAAAPAFTGSLANSAHFAFFKVSGTYFPIFLRTPVLFPATNKPATATAVATKPKTT